MNRYLDDFAQLAWVQLWQVAVVATLVAVSVRLWCRRRPRLAYALWMLVLFKALVPPVWSSPTSLFSWALVNSKSTSLATEVVPQDASAPSASIAPVSEQFAQQRHDSGPAAGELRHPTIKWPRAGVIGFYVWAGGLALGVVYVAGKHFVASILIRRSSLPVDERHRVAIIELSRRLGIGRRVRLAVTSRPIGPAVFGLLRPTILLPESLLSGMADEHAELVLAHELVHVRRRDELASKMQLAAQLIWWFNPLIWWVNQNMSRAREHCCDEEVIAGIGCKPVVYARALLNVLEQRGRLRSLVALPGVRPLEVNSQRLEAIMRYVSADRRRANHFARAVFMAGLLLFVPGTGLTITANLHAQDKQEGASLNTSPDAKSDQPIDGTWKIVQCEFSGGVDAGIVGTVHTIQDGKWLRPGRRTGEYRLTMDLSKSPIWVDLSADRLGDETLKGICSLEGDKLTICYAYDPKLPRPSEFKTTPNAKGYLYVLERTNGVGVKTATADNASTAAAKLSPELEKLQGKWKIIDCEFSGHDESQAAGTIDAISGDKWLRPNRRTAAYQLKLEVSKKPMWVDLGADRLGDKTLKGIISLEGDKLKICYSYNPDLPRPTEFKTVAGTPAYIYVLERVTK
ncbi:MAG TPA: M56 family metallopeptidase [Pirellulales bacterium]|nr:M56 family metallopeptidase [Pirellulales bacterium]